MRFTKYYTQQPHTVFIHKEMQQIFIDNLTIRFHLRQNQDKTTPTIIYGVFVYNNKTYRVNTNVKVKPIHWEHSKQRAKISSNFLMLDNQNNTIVNEKIIEIEFGFIVAKEYICNNPQCEIVDVLRNTINKKYKLKKMKLKTSKRKAQTATEVIWETLVERAKNREIKSESLRAFKPYINAFELYLEKNKIENTIANLNFKTFDGYAKHLERTKNSKYGTKCFKQIRSWVKSLPKEIRGEYKYDSDIDTIKMKIVKIPKRHQGEKYITLTENEIYRLYNLTDEEFSGQSKYTLEQLKLYRDLFCMQCFCGSRVSDVPQLFKEENYHTENEKPYLTFWAKKTDENENSEECVVPLWLYPESLTLFNKHLNIKLRETDLNRRNKYNEIVREICRIAKFDEKIGRAKECKGKIKTETKYKYEWITSHVARHSFITNCIRNKGLRPEQIKDIVGHSDTQYINKVYANLTNEDRMSLIDRAYNGSDYCQEQSKVTKKNCLGNITITAIEEQSNKIEKDILNNRIEMLYNALDFKIDREEFYKIETEVEDIHLNSEL